MFRIMKLYMAKDKTVFSGVEEKRSETQDWGKKGTGLIVACVDGPPIIHYSVTCEQCYLACISDLFLQSQLVNPSMESVSNTI